MHSLPFSKPFVLSTKRIGPHNYDLLCILMGSLLGDATMEKDGNGSRFCFYQESTHQEYLLWLHKTLFDYGYCKPDIPKVLTRSGVNGKIRYYCRFKTFTFSSFNWIYDSFYVSSFPFGSEGGNKPASNARLKIVPPFIGEFLTPLALAIWIMDDGCKIPNRGIRFSTNAFSLKEVKFLSQFFKDKYNFNTTIHKTGGINQYNIYITKESTIKLSNLVKPYIHPTMSYKIYKDSKDKG
jgi:ubiquinol-cytochrome c reductase cytochrome b subunit